MPNQPLYRAVASCHMHYYPGTLIETPPEYRHTEQSDPMPYGDAVRMLGEWRDAVLSPGCWEFSVQPYLATPAGQSAIAAAQEGR